MVALTAQQHPTKVCYKLYGDNKLVGCKRHVSNEAQGEFPMPTFKVLQWNNCTSCTQTSVMKQRTHHAECHQVGNPTSCWVPKQSSNATTLAPALQSVTCTAVQCPAIVRGSRSQ